MADSDALIGKTVSHYCVQEKPGGGGTIELWRFDADGQNGTTIADDVVTSDCLLDGNWAAFIKSNRKLYRISPFDDLGRAVALQWSPDDNGVQYLSTSGGATNVLEFLFTGGAAHRVINFTSGTIFDFPWTRDGKTLLAKGDVTSDVAMCVFTSSVEKPRPAAQCGHRLSTGRRYQVRLGHLGERSSFGRFDRSASRLTELRRSEQQAAVPGPRPKRFEKIGRWLCTFLDSC